MIINSCIIDLCALGFSCATWDLLFVLIVACRIFSCSIGTLSWASGI